MTAKRCSCRLVWGPALLLLAVSMACSHSSTNQSPSASGQSSSVPFHPQGDTNSVDAAQPDIRGSASDVVKNPETTRVPFASPDARMLPAGTLLTVRLQHPLSSANAAADSTFTAFLDEPIVLNGKTLLPKGTLVQGHLESARVSNANRKTGYLRLSLDSIFINDQDIPLQTSSLFARATAPGSASVTPSSINSSLADSVVRLRTGRRLTFRLTSVLDMNPRMGKPAKSKASS